MSDPVPEPLAEVEEVEEQPTDPDGKPPKIKSSDPLLWWKKHGAYFPTLGVMAKYYLSVQATSAPTERIFSAANRIIGAARTNLSPEMAGTLFFVGRNWN
jgi:hAT family C-terminal dimerisation region